MREPAGFLFDEPLSNLDAALRVQMRFEIARLHSTLKTTMIYVTHDQVEAMTLADRIVVLKDGLVMQVGTPVELYEKPVNLFVAEFIGSPKMNILPCRSADGRLLLDGHNGINGFTNSGTAPGTTAVTHLGIRPEHITPCAIADSHCSGTVDFAEYLGADTFLYVNCGAQGTLTVRTVGSVADIKGTVTGLRFDEQSLHLFDDTGQIIR